jgi:hypothetical protein
MATNNQTNTLINVNELNDKSFKFTDINFVDNRLKANIYSSKEVNGKNLPFNLLTDALITSYGMSDYQGSLSITCKFQSNIDDDKDEKFKKFCNDLQEEAKKVFIENAKKFLSKKDADKLIAKPKLISAYFNPIIKKDKNDVEEVKFKIRTDIKTSKPLLPALTVEKFQMENDNKKTISKEKIDLSKLKDAVNVMKENIRPGSHIQAVISPSIYWVNNKFGITFNIQALMVLKSLSTTIDNKAIDLDPNSIGFSPPKKNKDGVGYSALVLNKSTNGLSGKILTSSFKLAYGISEYENSPGTFDQSIVIMNQTNDDKSIEANDKFFEYAKQLNEVGLNYAEEHKEILFKEGKDEDFTKEEIEAAYFNKCVSQNKNDEDQIKLRINKDSEGIPQFTCFEYDNFDDETTKTEIKWSEMNDISNDIKNIIKGGSHVRAILQPRIYFISNKAGINFKLIELHINKNSYARQDFNNVFSFSEDNTKSGEIEKSNTNETNETNETNDSEVIIEEEEISIEEEVDSEAFGDGEEDDEEDDDEDDEDDEE